MNAVVSLSDDRFDKASSDLIDGLREAETGSTFERAALIISQRSPQNGASATSGVVDHEYKLPQETVQTLSECIEQTSLSPFDRSRKQRGVLSVRATLGCMLSLGD